MSKRNFVLTGICVLLVGLSAGQVLAAAPAHLQWMSFYNYEPWTFEGWTNYGFNQDLTLVSNGNPRGISGFVDVGQVFCRETWVGEDWGGWTLRDDWQQCWKAFVDLISPMVSSGKIIGFYMLDEPVWNGVTIAELTTMADTVKASFPSSIVWVTDASPTVTIGENILDEQVDYDPIPENIDWIGIDSYGPASNTQNIYETYLYPKMYASQRAIIVPQAYGSEEDPAKTLAEYETEMIAFADDYYDWAKTDTNIIGICPWHWLNRPQAVGYYEIGAGSMPGLRAKWEQIGAEIRANNPVAPKTEFSSFIQNFDSFANNERLPGTYGEPWGGVGISLTPPETSEVKFTTEYSCSAPISISMQTDNSAFRYSWGTNDRNTGRFWMGHPTQYIEFQVYIADENELNLQIIPYRGSLSPCMIDLTESFGLGVQTGKTKFYVADMNDFDDLEWNKVKIKIDLGDLNRIDDGIMTIWVNDIEKYNGSFISKTDAIFDTVRFIRRSGTGNCYLDDIGMWGEIGCGEWGYAPGDINRDCKVDMTDIKLFSGNWLNCTDPNDSDCENAL